MKIHDLRVYAKGIIDRSIQGRRIVIRGFEDGDLVYLKHMILEEVRRQNAEQEL